MDDQNKGVNERWAPPSESPERGYAREEAPAERSTGEIQADIERTRADMQETIGAIQDRLRPSNVASRAADSVRETASETMRTVGERARETFSGAMEYSPYGSGDRYGLIDRLRDHPVPAALAAVSLAWLAFSGRRHAPSDRAIYGSTAYGEPFVRETRMRDTGTHGTYEGYPREAYPGERYGQRAGHAVREAAEGLRGTAEGAREAAGEAAARMGDVTRQAGDRVRQTTRKAQSRLERMIDENPLALGALAMAAGAAVGLILPETRRERELMGEAREQFVEKAREAAAEAKERVQEAAGRAQEAAQQAATETLTGEDGK